MKLLRIIKILIILIKIIITMKLGQFEVKIQITKEKVIIFLMNIMNKMNKRKTK